MTRFRYRVRLGGQASKPPPLLRAFGWWLATHTSGSVGDFELEWRREGGLHAFARLADGRQLVLSADREPSVLLQRASGRRTRVAADLRAFLAALAKGRTGVAVLDHADAAVQRELATWLRLNRAVGQRTS